MFIAISVDQGAFAANEGTFAVNEGAFGVPLLTNFYA